MLRSAWVMAAALLAACGEPAPAPSSADRPARIVSLDYCADQYVLKLVDRDRILAVSPDAGEGFSYMRAEAAGLATLRPRLEDVLLAKPDLVVRSYGGGPGVAAALERAGVPVLQVGWTPDLESIRRVTLDMAEGLGETRRGQALIAEFDARLAALAPRLEGETALYMTPAGYTSGPGSLVHEVMTAAGLDNFEKRRGWRELPLERLAFEGPDLIAAGFFDRQDAYKDAWSAMRHPIARMQLDDRPRIDLPGAWTSCGAWYLIDAVEALAEGDRDGG